MKKFVFISVLALCLGCCAYAQSRLENCTIESRILGVTKDYIVYLPDGYDSSEIKEYPVLYLLHGSGGDYTTWTANYGMKQIVDWRISSGFALPMIIVMPDASGDGPGHRGPHQGYFNYPDWKYEDFFISEFIPQVEKRFRICSRRGSRAVAGLSMGGGGTTIFAMHYPELFSSACPMSGRVEGVPKDKFNGDESMREYLENIKNHDMVAFLRNASKEKQQQIATVRWLIDCGDSDYLFEGSTHLYELMKSLDFPCAQFRVREGTHYKEYWRQSLPECLTFVSIGFAGRIFE